MPICQIVPVSRAYPSPLSSPSCVLVPSFPPSLPIFLFVRPSVCLSVCVHLPVCLFNCLSFPRERKKHMNINKFAGLSRVWVGGKNLFMCFFWVTPYGGEKHINKISPPKIPGQSREMFICGFCLYVFFSLPGSPSLSLYASTMRSLHPCLQRYSAHCQNA